MPSIYRPRRPRASPLWQIVHHGWASFLAEYETVHRPIHGPLRPDAVAVVEHFYHCGDLACGFTRHQCPNCGLEKLLSFSCKKKGFCPSCNQRRVKQTAHWIAHDLCFNVPHRQFVFTMPKPLRGILRKRRKLLTLLFQVAIGCLREWFRTRLDLPDGELAAIAGVQSFGDYLVFHPHLHILIARLWFSAAKTAELRRFGTGRGKAVGRSYLRLTGVYSGRPSLDRMAAPNGMPRSRLGHLEEIL